MKLVGLLQDCLFLKPTDTFMASHVSMTDEGIGLNSAGLSPILSTSRHGMHAARFKGNSFRLVCRRLRRLANCSTVRFARLANNSISKLRAVWFASMLNFSAAFNFRRSSISEFSASFLWLPGNFNSSKNKDRWSNSYCVIIISFTCIAGAKLSLACKKFANRIFKIIFWKL